MNQTKKLYDVSPYDTDFDAVVIDCKTIDQDGSTLYQVILDQTLFFPEEGGQSPDTGTLNDCNVVDVQIHNEVVSHYLNTPLSVGTQVHGTIDWDHRFGNMQQHSGEHIFSGLVHNTFGFDNVGFHLSDQIVTMDFNGVLTSDDLNDIERKANQVIVSDLPIEISYPSKEELSNLAYRSKIEIDGQVRIVTIPDVDVCACCAPHVRQTGEIGMLKVMSCQSYKGGVRISILCGFRALLAFQEKNTILSALTTQLSTSQDAIPAAVKRLSDTIQTQKMQIAQLQQDKLQNQIDSIPAGQKNVLLFASGLDTPVIRSTVNDLVTSHEGLCGIFNGTDETGYSYIIGSRTIDCKSIASLLREQCQAKGGGSNVMIQGSVAARKEVLLSLLMELF